MVGRAKQQVRSGLSAILDKVVREAGRGRIDLARFETFGDWWRHCRRELRSWPKPIDRAVLAGVLSPSPGYAFASGYQSALHRLVPSCASGDILSLLVTEEAGGHPKAIRTVLRRVGSGQGTSGGKWKISGKKEWATLATEAKLLLVAARAGTDAKGRNRIRLAKVARSAAGVRVELMPSTPFTPEIIHGRVTLEGVVVTSQALLPGDGYERYIKPFRTVEDAHVSGALLGYLLSVAYRYDWPREACGEIMGLVAALREIALADPRGAAVHVALGGVLALQGRFLEMARVHWRLVDEETRLQWERDEPIMKVAARARARRFDVAWDRLASGASSLGKVAPPGGCPV